MTRVFPASSAEPAWTCSAEALCRPCRSPSSRTVTTARALRLMTAGRHQGKLVLKAPSGPDDAGFTVADARPLLDPDATYLVTGGLGGFGLRLLPYLAFSGARHVTLMDRDPERRRNAEWIRESSALGYADCRIEFDIVSGDVAVEEDVRRCISELKRTAEGRVPPRGHARRSTARRHLAGVDGPGSSRPRPTAPCICIGRQPASPSTTSSSSRPRRPHSATPDRSTTARPAPSWTPCPSCGAARACHP